VELLEAVGFRVGDKSRELFVIMDEVLAGDERLSGNRRVVLLNERTHHFTPLVVVLRWRLTPRRAAAMGLMDRTMLRRLSIGRLAGVQFHIAFNLLDLLFQSKNFLLPSIINSLNSIGDLLMA